MVRGVRWQLQTWRAVTFLPAIPWYWIGMQTHPNCMKNKTVIIHTSNETGIVQNIVGTRILEHANMQVYCCAFISCIMGHGENDQFLPNIAVLLHIPRGCNSASQIVKLLHYILPKILNTSPEELFWKSLSPTNWFRTVTMAEKASFLSSS